MPVLWVLFVAVGLCVPLVVANFFPSATVAYDGQNQTKLAYDCGLKSAVGYDAVLPLARDEKKNGANGDRISFANSAKFLAAEGGVKDLTYLYHKVGAEGEHLKFGITKNPATRYTEEELAGGRLKIIGQGSREDMLQLERNLHETLPIGPEEAQKFYIQKQIEKGLKPPPYNP